MRVTEVTEFKEGFRGQLVHHIGAYDYPVSRFLYRIYSLTVPRYLEVLRKRDNTCVAQEVDEDVCRLSDGNFKVCFVDKMGWI